MTGDKFQAPCVRCKKIYWSLGACLDYGQCPSCSDDDMRKIRANWRKVISPSNKKTRPDHLGKDQLQKIRVYFDTNRGILWKRKAESVRFLNIHFNLNLTMKQVEAITNTTTMKANGFNCKSKF